MAETAAPERILFDASVDARFRVRQIIPAFAGPELANIAFDDDYRAVAEKKYQPFIVKAYDLSAPAANILKQTCLSLGTDAGVHRGAINCTIDREAVLITASRAQLEKLILKLRPQPFSLNKLAHSLRRMLDRQHAVATYPVEVMAVINVTPDSFSDATRLMDPESILAAAHTAIDSGATILDIGGESTRPGALPVDAEEEQRRVLPIIKLLRSTFPQVSLSIDTRHAQTAKQALAHGASIVNDVSGLTYDIDMASVVLAAGCRVVIMHSKGTPQTMQQNPHYDDVIGEISDFFYQQIATAQSAGIDTQKIILDPGFGFGKTKAHNLEIMRRLPELVSLGFPVLVGTSRKSFLSIGEDPTPVMEREALTAASIAVALQNGARLVRVHDVATQMPVVQWTLAMLKANSLE